MENVANDHSSAIRNPLLELQAMGLVQIDSLGKRKNRERATSGLCYSETHVPNAAP